MEKRGQTPVELLRNKATLVWLAFVTACGTASAFCATVGVRMLAEQQKPPQAQSGVCPDGTLVNGSLETPIFTELYLDDHPQPWVRRPLLPIDAIPIDVYSEGEVQYIDADSPDYDWSALDGQWTRPDTVAPAYTLYIPGYGLPPVRFEREPENLEFCRDGGDYYFREIED